MLTGTEVGPGHTAVVAVRYRAEYIMLRKCDSDFGYKTIIPTWYTVGDVASGMLIVSSNKLIGRLTVLHGPQYLM